MSSLHKAYFSEYDCYLLMTEKGKGEFKIDDDEKNRLEAIRTTFYEMIWCNDGNNYDLEVIGDEESALIERILIENCTLLKKDPLLFNKINSVCARHRADFEPYFPTPDDLRKIFRKDFATGLLLLHGSIVKSGIRLAHQIRYTKRGFNKNMCDFLIGKGMMTADEYASLQNLRKYSEEARFILIMEPPPKDEIVNCETLYERMIFELFRLQVSKNIITTPDD